MHVNVLSYIYMHSKQPVLCLSSTTTYFSHKYKYMYWSVEITIRPPYQSGMMADFTD